MRCDVVEAASVAEACALLHEYGPEAKILAGGQSLLVLLKERIVEPGLLVNIKRLRGLERVTVDGNGLTIGALATHRAVAVSPAIREHWPALASAAAHVGSVQIRSLGTLGGNLSHADPASDPPPVLLVLNASVTAEGPTGSRRVPLDTFFADYYTTALAPDELLTTVHLPSLPPRTGTAYIKFARRGAVDFAVVGVAVAVTLAPEVPECVGARIALGAVGPTPLRAPDAEEALVGGRLTAPRLREAGALAAKAAQPTSDVRASAEYRRDMVAVLTRRALTQALATVGVEITA